MKFLWSYSVCLSRLNQVTSSYIALMVANIDGSRQGFTDNIRKVKKKKPSNLLAHKSMSMKDNIGYNLKYGRQNNSIRQNKSWLKNLLAHKNHFDINIYTWLKKVGLLNNFSYRFGSYNWVWWKMSAVIGFIEA